MKNRVSSTGFKPVAPGQGPEKRPNVEDYDGQIAGIQSHLNVAFLAIEETIEALEALKIRRKKETDGQFSLL